MRFKLISWIAVILWMGVIFSLSTQPAAVSNELSKGVTEIVIEAVEKVLPAVSLEVEDYNHYIRKNAHFFAYMLLGVLVANALRTGDSRTVLANVVLAGVICAGYAVSDEIHQLFVSGRGAQVKDVLIDSGGAAVGIMMWQVAIVRASDLRSGKRIRELGWTGAVGEKG
ncbi:MAG: VanZ family protein [Acidaminobacter sp.]|nr:VanZ family protein [Acidaminobacter sp.]